MLNTRCFANLGYRGIAVVAAFMVAMLVMCVPPAASAYAQDDIRDQSAMGLAAGQSDDALPIWAQDTGEKAGSRLTIQSSVDEIRKFDLRNSSDGIAPKIVTPVRAQNPFATCWAFGAIAAAETSIAADLGKENLDLSEKHLAWYGMHPLTEYDTDTQVGEGIHVFNEDEVLDASYIASNPIIVSSVFGSGVGPLSEKAFPYHGINGLTNYEYLVNHKSQWEADVTKEYQELDEATRKALLGAYGCQDFDELLRSHYAFVKEGYEKGTRSIYYSASCKDASDESKYLEDWRIPTLDESGDSNRNTFEGYTLRDGNLMPDFTKTVDGEVVPNEEGMQAVKQELLRWHGVACLFHADTFMPGDTGESKYINVEDGTWAHYTYDEQPPNHGVCIIGWDDDYPASNFKAGKTPPGNGAWIAKNSWGCKDGCETKQDSTLGTEVIGKNNWGIDGSGYFYISYYDKSLVRGESFTFSDDLDGDEFYANQYDFMPATDWFLVPLGTGGDLISAANVFTAETDQRITSVSTCSDEPNARVTFALYLLGEDAKNPTDGELVGKQSCDFKYAGYHRIDLDEPFFVRKGQRFTVVSSVKIGEKYQVMASAAYSKEKAEKKSEPFYSEAKVNKGESYYYKGGSWIDWADYQSTDEFQVLLEKTGKTGDVIDNFPIKAFGVSAKNSDNPPSTTPGGKVGATYAVGGNSYKVTSNSQDTVTFAKAGKAKKIVVPATVEINGKSYKVTAIGPAAFKSAKKTLKSVVIRENVAVIAKGAFKGCPNLKTLTVKTKKLTKKKVKGSLAGSKVKTVKVKVGSKKVNKKYVKKYKKIFTKKNCGKKVAVK